MKLNSFFKDASKVYQAGVQAAHIAKSSAQQISLFIKYPELAGKLKYVFNDRSELQKITADVANDSKADLRRMLRKIGGVPFKAKRASV